LRTDIDPMIRSQMKVKNMTGIRFGVVQGGYGHPYKKKGLTAFCHKSLFLLVELRGIEPLTS
jgi:hypothetical protein